jgi:hypothetical protein
MQKRHLPGLSTSHSKVFVMKLSARANNASILKKFKLFIFFAVKGCNFIYGGND